LGQPKLTNPIVGLEVELDFIGIQPEEINRVAIVGV
jgi:hypothetical protein